MNKRIVVFCLIMIASGVHSLWAWANTGHRVVAQIAEDRLSDSTKAKIKKIIGNVHLQDIASCADEIRTYKNKTTHKVDCSDNHEVSCGSLTLQNKPESYFWHFIDGDINDKTVTKNNIVEKYCSNPEDQCDKSGKDCVVAKILDFQAVLKNPKSSDSDRLYALMFLVHFVGDMHQPLHCANDKDRGGNDKKFPYLGAPVSAGYPNLHSIWDDLLTNDYSVNPNAVTDWTSKCEADIKSRGSEVDSWTALDPAEWAFESYSIAQMVIYPRYYQNPGADPGTEYQKDMTPFVQEQLEKAGVRLAALLEDCFGNGLNNSVETNGRANIKW